MGKRYKQLNLSERIFLQSQLKRMASTVSRELRRNGFRPPKRITLHRPTRSTNNPVRGPMPCQTTSVPDDSIYLGQQ